MHEWVTTKMTTISTLGDTANTLYAEADNDRIIYLLGSMGSAIPFALGYALTSAQPIRVLEGDGALLMQLGTLATVASNKVDIRIAIVDNGCYSSTGGQPTALAASPGIDVIAAASGIQSVAWFGRAGDERAAAAWLDASAGPRLAVLHVPRPDIRHPFVPLSRDTLHQRAVAHLDL